MRYLGMYFAHISLTAEQIEEILGCLQLGDSYDGGTDPEVTAAREAIRGELERAKRTLAASGIVAAPEAEGRWVGPDARHIQNPKR